MSAPSLCLFLPLSFPFLRCSLETVSMSSGVRSAGFSGRYGLPSALVSALTTFVEQVWGVANGGEDSTLRAHDLCCRAGGGRRQCLWCRPHRSRRGWRRRCCRSSCQGRQGRLCNTGPLWGRVGGPSSDGGGCLLFQRRPPRLPRDGHGPGATATPRLGCYLLRSGVGGCEPWKRPAPPRHGGRDVGRPRSRAGEAEEEGCGAAVARRRSISRLQ